MRVQWDPERSLQLSPLPHRSLQVGLSGEAVNHFVDEWTVAITDATATVRAIHGLVRAHQDAAASAMLPAERPYPIPVEVAPAIGATAA